MGIMQFSESLMLDWGKSSGNVDDFGFIFYLFSSVSCLGMMVRSWVRYG